MGVQMQDHLIPAVSHGAVTSSEWKAQWGGLWHQEYIHK